MPIKNIVHFGGGRGSGFGLFFTFPKVLLRNKYQVVIFLPISNLFVSKPSTHKNFTPHWPKGQTFQTHCHKYIDQKHLNNG